MDTEQQARENKIKNSIDEIQYYTERLEGIKKAGNIYVCSCCFHTEKTPSLRIYPPGFKNSDGKEQEFSSFYCFGCGRGGDLIKFEELYEDLDSREEAILSLQKQYDIDIDDSDIINELKLTLNDIQNKPTTVTLESLNDINFICSIMCRNYLQYVKNNFNHLLEQEFLAIQEVYAKLDEQLLDMNAKEAQSLVNITQNTINNRKNLLTLLK